LENAIENIVKEEPNSAISLSGGLDSRIIAGIVAKLGYNLPAITYYSLFEAKIASKICDKLKLKHYYAPFNYKIDKSFLKKVVSLIVELGGTNDIVTLVNYLKQETILQNLGKSGIIGGGRFNEVLGLNLLCKGKKLQKNHLKKLGYNYYPRKILNKAYHNLYSYCSQMTPNEFYLTILVQRNLNRQIKLSYKLPNIKYPVLDQNVLSTIYSLPSNERINKNLQRRILKKYFPDLYCIPTNNSIKSYLDPLTLKMVRILEYIQRRRGLNRPINTFGVEYFF